MLQAELEKKIQLRGVAHCNEKFLMEVKGYTLEIDTAGHTDDLRRHITVIEDYYMYE